MQKDFCTDIEVLRKHIEKAHNTVMTTPSKKRRRCSLSDAPEPWSDSDNNSANLLLTEMLCECALPFNVTEHPTFLKWMSFVNKSYKVADRHTIATTNLDLVYKTAKAEVLAHLKDKHIVIAVDGSQDGSGEPIAHITATTPNGPEILLKQVLVHKSIQFI